MKKHFTLIELLVKGYINTISKLYQKKKHCQVFFWKKIFFYRKKVPKMYKNTEQKRRFCSN